MKRFRPRCFDDVLRTESEKIKVDVKVERLRRLVWCWNKYSANIPAPVYNFIILAEYYRRIKNNCPNIWLPEIKKKD